MIWLFSKNLYSIIVSIIVGRGKTPLVSFVEKLSTIIVVRGKPLNQGTV